MAVDSHERNSDDEYETSESSNIIEPPPRKPSQIKIEVPLFLTLMGLALSGTAVNNIVLYRICVHSLDYSKDVCRGFLSPDNTNDTHEIEEEVQKYATFFQMVSSIQAIFPAVLSLFIGAWSDAHGRKPLIVWPLFGVTMTGMLITVYSMLDGLGPWWYIFAVLPFSVTGGYTVLITGSYCYISDTTTTDKRSIKIFMVEGAVAVGNIAGSMLSAHLLRLIGNTYLLLIVTALYVTAYSSTNIFLYESLTSAEPPQGGLRSIIDIGLIKKMVTDCLKQRPNHGRAKIFLVTLANTFTMFIVYGSLGLEYLYMRQKLDWALSNYTTFSGVNTAVSFIGSILAMTVFQRVLGLRDVPLALASYSFSVVDCLIKAFAATTWQMYVTAVFFFKALSGPLMRSFLTKMLPAEDLAKVLALLCTMESVLCPIVAPLIYNTLYNFTIHDFPGAFYLLSASINAVCVVMIGFVMHYGADPTPYQQLPATL
ncbi:proton-coupled folate transporter-like [Leguminivora glycinivorella]|uniref:proton-coupled folate transporter-like n=1 Tax=Leguminivora glycinivorella TaxID=1035111 RepID=UPI00200E2535|nr:proton-coupled folate transporter-like [Leguminivora glycinivorella]